MKGCKLIEQSCYVLSRRASESLATNQLKIDKDKLKFVAGIDQFRYIKIQPNTKDFSTRLWGISPPPHSPRGFAAYF